MDTKNKDNLFKPPVTLDIDVEGFYPSTGPKGG